MLRRLACALPLLVAAGCTSPPTLAGSPVAEPAAPTTEPDAGRLWEQGQEAMRRQQPTEAVRLYEKSLDADPMLARSHLSLAAAQLQLGRPDKACSHLGAYVAAQPGQVMIRLRYADLLARLGKASQARGEFERFDADAQEREEVEPRHFVHCHSRLMEIAQDEGDDYREHLHRGIGLFHLARERGASGTGEGELSCEGLLCKAAGELALARGLRSDEARPCWYLSLVWSRLAQQQPARRWLLAAHEAAPFSYLTGTEKQQLHFARARLRDPILVK